MVSFTSAVSEAIESNSCERVSAHKPCQTDASDVLRLLHDPELCRQDRKLLSKLVVNSIQCVIRRIEKLPRTHEFESFELLMKIRLLEE